ncbi:MAG: glutamate-5-semialdehyde dehydrogenase [Chloroflexi bacterium CG23_combo_of_CG06-09_8_20_14_all_45_10]|nr:MAG: glutamate-5-semialdehyde dehydrogenase [Chloroflexi bacterium CG23_combo_of_CG06-09_8_20_14_all_45_10]
MELALKELEEKGRAAKAASKKLAFLSTEIKNKALLNVAEALIDKQSEILAANRIDYEEAKASGMSEAMLDRLMLSPSRLEAISQDVETVAALPDPVGEIFEMRTLPNGLQIGKKRVPLGVIGAIYESRPNVTIDISSLCLKSGNAVILRGGKEAINSNSALAKVAQQACLNAGVPEGAIQFIESTERALVNHMLQMKGVIDLIIPRGGPELIKLISENAAMPVITGGVGVCHTYVDKSADLGKAVAIAYNAKVQRPTVCNALDCLLVHSQVAQTYLPSIAQEWAKAGVEMHCDEQALDILKPVSSLKLVPAVDGDWGKEFLSLTAAIKMVDSLDEALEHIEKYGSGHSEAIVTEDYSTAMRFLNEVDAACVYANASTRFTDGGQFGLGAEIGISTQKFHARGPMGLKELTSYKWIIYGSGQVRP